MASIVKRMSSTEDVNVQSVPKEKPWERRAREFVAKKATAAKQTVLGELEDQLDMSMLKSAMADPDLLKKMTSIMDAVKGHTIDRGEVITSIMLAILAGGRKTDGRLFGEHVLLVGPPGVAKTFVADLIFMCIVMTDEDLSDIQYHKFVTADEVIGPIDGESIKKDGKIRRKVEGFLPSAWFSIADEAGLAGVVNGARLKLMNERRFRNYDLRMKTNLITEVATSNQFLKEEDMALRDRYLFSLYVGDIGLDEKTQAELERIQNTPFNPPMVSLEEIFAAKLKTKEVRIPKDVRKTLKKVFMAVMKEGVYVSPRTRGAIDNVLKANAWLNGRTVVEDADIEVIWPCLWRTEPQLPKVKAIVMKAANEEMSRYVAEYDAVNKEYKEAKVLVALKEKAKIDGKDISNDEQHRLIDIVQTIGTVRTRWKGELASKIKSEKNKEAVTRNARELKTWWEELMPYATGDSELVDSDID